MIFASLSHCRERKRERKSLFEIMEPKARGSRGALCNTGFSRRESPLLPVLNQSPRQDTGSRGTRRCAVIARPAQGTEDLNALENMEGTSCKHHLTRGSTSIIVHVCSYHLLLLTTSGMLGWHNNAAVLTLCHPHPPSFSSHKLLLSLPSLTHTNAAHRLQTVPPASCPSAPCLISSLFIPGKQLDIERPSTQSAAPRLLWKCLTQCCLKGGSLWRFLQR